MSPDEPRRTPRPRAGVVGLATVACLVLPVAPLGAGTIRLVVSTTTALLPEGLRTDVQVTNDGDEPAFDLVPHVEFFGARGTGRTQAALLAGATVTMTLDTPAAPDPQMPGAWPVVVRIAYRDGGQRPWEALHVTVARRGVDERPPDVQVRVDGGRVTSTGTLKAWLERARAVPPLRATFLAPAGLVLEPAQLSVAPDVQGPIDIHLRSAVAAGAALPVFAIVEYDDPGRHVTAIGSTTVEVVDNSRLTATRWALPLLVACVAAWIAVALRARRPRTEVHGT
jgi:hypothetical protein